MAINKGKAFEKSFKGVWWKRKYIFVQADSRNRQGTNIHDTQLRPEAYKGKCRKAWIACQNQKYGRKRRKHFKKYGDGQDNCRKL